MALLVSDAALSTPAADAILSDVNTLLNAGDAAGGSFCCLCLLYVLACDTAYACWCFAGGSTLLDLFIHKIHGKLHARQPGLWTDDERREVLDGIRPWMIQQQAARQQAQKGRQQLQDQQSRSARGGVDTGSPGRDQAGLPGLQQQQQALTEGPDAVWSAFIERARSNLHWVLAMSPIGDAFRSRCRQFPSLVSCTTADWFSPWPAEALRSVAERSLGAMPLLAQPAASSAGGDAAASSTRPATGQRGGGGLTAQTSGKGRYGGTAEPSLVQRAAALMVEVHTGVQAAADRLHQALRRRCDKPFSDQPWLFLC